MPYMEFYYICIVIVMQNGMTTLRIKQICKDRGMTLQELAKAVGVSLNSISGFATGKQKPSLDTLEKLATALNVEVGELFVPKNDFVAFVRMNGQTYTFNTKEELSAFVDDFSNYTYLCCN